MIFKINFKKLIISLAIPFLVAGLSSLITAGNMDIYSEINKPPLAPPGWLFPVVWSVLYLLMGISLYLVWNKKTLKSKKSAYLFFTIQLFLNFLWSPIFFNLRAYLLAFAVLILLIFSVIGMIIAFYKINKKAALLQIPYLLWILFAAILNFAIYYIN